MCRFVNMKACTAHSKWAPFSGVRRKAATPHRRLSFSFLTVYHISAAAGQKKCSPAFFRAVFPDRFSFSQQKSRFRTA
jgi:hypothetical protein